MSLSLAIVFPVVLLLVLLVVQSSMWWYGRQLALTAAREGVDAGRMQGNTGDAVKNAAAVEQAGDFLRRQGGRDFEVSTAGSTPELIRVTVSVRSAVLVPGLSGITITQSAQAPRERFVPPVVSTPKPGTPKPGGSKPAASAGALPSVAPASAGSSSGVPSKQAP
ncbi:TadE/TadG family type IV pilus assembly protein [Kitasatospora sp. NPDC058170]|uniref:TadE/TadG family type IV pilus assembly protein n=1 Tax=Kitasatospora sp. NPDC058170 TaxID=3346364 RepID=UPI0036D83EEB